MVIRHRRQVRRRVGDCLDAWLLVIRDERDFGRGLVRRPRFRSGTGLGQVGFLCPKDGNFLINTQDFGHLGFKFRIAPLQVVAHFVRLHLLVGENLANCALRDSPQAGVPRCWTMLAGVASQQPRRPEFVRISHLLGLLAGQRHQPRARFNCDLRLLAGPRTVVERLHDAEPDRARQAALDGLVGHSNRDPNPVTRRIIPIGVLVPNVQKVTLRKSCLFKGLSHGACNRGKTPGQR